MKNRFGLVLSFMVSLMMLYACHNVSINQEQVGKLQGKTWFLACNLFPDALGDHSISSVNYHIPGEVIPWGTPVEISDISDEEVFLLDKNNNKEYRYVFHGKTMQVTTAEKHLRRILLQDITELQQKVSNMSEIDRKGINDAMVYKGMSKEAVLIAIGYPPEFVTPDPMTSDTWNYWAKRHDQFFVEFSPDGKVQKIYGLYPPIGMDKPGKEHGKTQGE